MDKGAGLGRRQDEANFQLFVRMIVHDLNNLLGGISGHASLIEAFAEPGGEIQESARIISRAADRAIELAREIPRFTGDNSVRIEAVDLHAVVREVAGLIPRTAAAGIRVALDLRAPTPEISGDSRQIFQMVLNLAVNARDAMPRGGQLRLSTEADGPGMLRLDVADTGDGIPDEIRPRIFEPFFTTRVGSPASGLGLTIVRRVVEQHGGRIEVSSRRGTGTTFSVWLPVRCAA
jgi:signal transduction histidine kinase